MKTSTTGYKNNSKDKNEPILKIPSNNITMEGVNHNVIAVDDNGKITVMKPNKNYYFPDSESIIEIPMKQKGGMVNISEFENYLSSLDESSQEDLIDYIDSMDEEAQTKFLMGGRTQWRKYQRGGLVPVEVEGEETILTNKGELYEFRGKKHAQGGIDVSLEEGSRIFSEHLKADPNVASSILGRKTDKKLSYADLSKKFDTTKWIKILENPDADKYQKETARLKLANNQSMLDVIFAAQETQKMKSESNKFNKFQKGGNVKNFKDADLIDFDPKTGSFVRRREDGSFFPKDKVIDFTKSKQGVENNLQNNLDNRLFGNETSSEPSDPWNVQINAVPGQFILPPSSPDDLTPKASTTVLDIVAPTKSKPVGTLPQTTKPTNSINSTKSRSSKTEPKSKPTDKPADNTYQFSKIQPFDKLETRPLSGVVSERGVPDISEYEVDPNTFEYDDSKVKKNNAFGIGSKLAGTILDIGLAMSDKLKVDPPQYRDLRKYPLFSRYVDFDDKEVGRVTALSVQQIQNSNMPEEVKQSRIADLMAQYKDYQAKIDFGNAQRYESKLMQDTEKLQNYVNANIDQQYQDMERYREKKARVDYLIDQFKAQRKSRIVNSIKSYADYVDRVNYQNQIYGDNYKVNPVTGKIQFTGATPDLLKQQEQQLAQYSQNSVPVQNLPGGAYMTRLPSGKEIIIDSTGKATVVN